MVHKQLQLAAAIALMGIAALVSADTECGSSVMFGAPWQPNNPYYIQESAWKTHGNITKLNLYFNKNTGCLRGVKPTYGWQAANARRLGVEKLPNDTPLAETDLKLQPGEYFNKVEFKFGGCITYLGLHTNKGRTLTVGDPAASGLLQTSAPEADGGFLAYFKGYTDQPMISVSVGNLQQLQFIWGAKVCAPTLKPLDPYPLNPRDTAVQRPMAQAAAEQQQPVVEEVDDSANVTAAQEPAAAEAPVPAASSPAPAAAASTSETTAMSPAAAADMVHCSGAACAGGSCPTASCALNGMGKDVLTMKCFGTNIVPIAMIDLAVQNACTNLACKLDRPNCTSTGILGVGGFCTGKVVAMAAADKIHPSGKAFLGYPCMETKGLIVDMVPVIGDYTAKGTYMAKAWKVCDCINGFGLVNNSIAFSTYKGGSITINPPTFPTLPKFPFINRALINMSMPDVVAQWVVANQHGAQVPKVLVDEQTSSDLKELIVNFTVPAVLVPKISMSLLKIPKGFSLPVFTIPVGDKTLTKVTKIMPDLTSLPTIVVPKWKMPSLPKIHMPEVTISNLTELAHKWGVPTMPKSLPLFKMNLSDVAAQWQAANEFDLLVPKISLPEFKVGTLKNIIPSFKVPSLVIANISAPLLHLPSPFSMPVFTLPSDKETLQAISELFPKMNSLPHFMVPEHGLKIKIPALSLPNITSPHFGDIVQSLGAAITKPKTPSLSSFNLTVPNFLSDLPKLNLPHFPSSINFTIPGIQVPDFSGVISAVNNMPDLNLNWTNLPNTLDTWKEKYLDNPAGFDWSGFLEMLKSNPIASKMAHGVELSIDVPDAIAPWVVGIAQKAPLPKFKVAKAVLKQLRKIIPGLPDAPSLLVVNITSPYLKTDKAVGNLATVVIPDDVAPQVHQLLPNLTAMPTVLIPEGEVVNANITLPDVARPEVVQKLSTAAASQAAAAPAAAKSEAETPTAATATAGPAAAAAPEQTSADTPNENKKDKKSDEKVVTPSDGSTAAPASAAAAMPVVKPAPPESPAPAAAAASPAAAPAKHAAAPVAAGDANETVTEVPEESITAASGTFTPAAAAKAAGGGPAGSKPTQTQKTQIQAEAESKSGGGDVLEAGDMVTDDEGAWVIDSNTPGIQTAFMDPREFYALDKNTQSMMKAMFAS